MNERFKHINISGFDKDMAYSNRFSSEIMDILNRSVKPVMRRASDFQDMNRATDFTRPAQDFASRIRRPGYTDKYKYEITM